jgi:hypothetical protein
VKAVAWHVVVWAWWRKKDLILKNPINLQAFEGEELRLLLFFEDLG